MCFVDVVGMLDIPFSLWLSIYQKKSNILPSLKFLHYVLI